MVTASIFAIVVYRASRRQLLSFRFTVGWLALCALGLFAGILAPVLVPIGDRIRLSSSGLLAVGGIILLVGICVQLSINIAVLQSRVRTLTEEVARLELTMNDQGKSAEPN